MKLDKGGVKKSEKKMRQAGRKMEREEEKGEKGRKTDNFFIRFSFILKM